MTDLIAELAEELRRINAYCELPDGDGVSMSAALWAERWADRLHESHATLPRILTDYAAIRAAHHDLVIRLGEVTTELEAARKDAARWRSFGWAEAPMVTVTGSQLARGIRPGDFAVPWDWPVTSKTRVRLIAMRDSAREDSNE